MAELDSNVDPVSTSPARFLTGSLAGAHLAGSADQEDQEDAGTKPDKTADENCPVHNTTACLPEDKKP